MAPADVLEIVAFERSSRTSYAACGLPYLVGGLVKTPDGLVVRTPGQHRARGIDVRIRHEAGAIDCAARTVTVRNLDTGRESVEHCDELLISTGASGVTPPWPGTDAEGVLQLRTLDDAAEVEHVIDAGARRAVVVGAGCIGLEVAEGLLARGLDVTVVELLDAPMGAVLDADMAGGVADAMRASGIGVGDAGGIGPFVALGTQANKQGRVAGTSIAGGQAAFGGVLGTAITRFRDVQIARTGLTEREARCAPG